MDDIFTSMMFLIVLVASLFVAQFFGHIVHWAIHQRWSGPMYRGHLQHHCELYPPNDLMSEGYRSAHWANSGPFLFTPALLIILGVTCGLLQLVGAPLWVSVVFALTVVGFGLFSDWIHDSGHIVNHWALRFRWFRTLRALHFQHHRNMAKNFGIVSFLFDHLFGTFLDR